MVAERVSVVVPTVDRSGPVSRLIEALRLQTHDRFEVVVVVGPTTDDTVERLDASGLPLKVVRCEERNLARARNIGIAAASGDIVAFLDDDAVPEPVWLDALVEPFRDPAVGATGGIVFDNLGTSLEVEAVVATRLGAIRHVRGRRPSSIRCFPGSWEFPYAPGGNGAYRRSALVGVTGFDEVYDYYLDETDVCVRLIDAGWSIVTGVRAPIHHKSLPSGVRNDRRVVTNWYPIVRNRTYFGCRHALPEVELAAVVESNERYREAMLAVSHGDLQAGRMTAAEYAQAVDSARDAVRDGLTVASSDTRRTQLPDADPTHFLRFPTAGGGAAHRLVVHLAAIDRELDLREPGVEPHVIGYDDRADASVELIDGVWHHFVSGSSPTGVVDELARLAAYRDIDQVVDHVVDHVVDSSATRAPAPGRPA